jgi:hypothetical protein
MSEYDNARRAPLRYIATARAYGFDLAATAVVFVCVSIIAGRVWRFPFDDEIATLLPLAVSQGDALRWYPVFAALIVSFVALYLAPRHDWQRLWSALALGLAASTDFSAALIVPPFLIYRHLLQRRFRWSFEVAYWLILASVPIGRDDDAKLKTRLTGGAAGRKYPDARLLPVSQATREPINRYSPCAPLR